MTPAPSFVTTSRDRALWKKADEAAEKAGHKGDYAYIVGTFKKMHPDYVADKPQQQELKFAAYEYKKPWQYQAPHANPGWLDRLQEICEQENTGATNPVTGMTTYAFDQGYAGVPLPPASHWIMQLAKQLKVDFKKEWQMGKDSKAGKVATNCANLRTKGAAAVLTDTANIYAISPEGMQHLFESSEWDTLVEDKKVGQEECDRLIREWGGSVFHTGSDGEFEVLVPRFRSKPNGEQVPVGTDWGRIKKEWLMGKDSKAGKIATNWATPEGDGWKIARSVKEVLEKLKPMFPKIPFTLKQGDGAHGLETRILVGTDTFVMGGGLRNDPKWTLLVYKQGQNPGLNEYEKSNGWNKPVPDADQIMTIVHKVLKESPDWVKEWKKGVIVPHSAFTRVSAKEAKFMNTTNRIASRWMQKKASLGQSKMQALLGMLHAIYWSHWTFHWQSRGKDSYGDHLLFERLYTALRDEIDGTAEKMVAKYGENAVDPTVIQRYSLRFLETNNGGFDTGLDQSPIASALSLERGLQQALEVVYKELEDAGELSLGLDNFIQGIADTHETHVYLLQQRFNQPEAK